MGILNLIFGAMGMGGGRNVIRDTVEIFKPNAENEAQRTAEYQSAALAQFAAEYGHTKNWFDSLIDGLNRLPRPMLAFGTIFLLVSALYDPVWFSERMTGLQLVPEQLWWLLGAIVTFYFGARETTKDRESNNINADRVRTVVDSIREINDINEGSPPASTSDNPALDDWERSTK